MESGYSWKLMVRFDGKEALLIGRDPQWEQFAKLTARCYKDTENGNTLNACRHDAFDTLMEIIGEKRGEKGEE